MRSKEIETKFLKSALTLDNPFMSLEELRAWLEKKRKAAPVRVEPIRFSEMDQWFFHPDTGNLVHRSGKFFSIEGIEVRTNWGPVPEWHQPIINQPEIGILGMITKTFHGILFFLVQAKIEPGNIHSVQLAPTLQATHSNYTRVHEGSAPPYLEFFREEQRKGVRVLLDQLQSEQGARFLRKRNRNLIVEVEGEVEVLEDFCWLTLGQIKRLLLEDNCVNMDTRAVISGISYGDYPAEVTDLLNVLRTDTHPCPYATDLLISALESERHLHEIEEIISWVTKMKSRYELHVTPIPLRNVKHWIRDEYSIHHEQRKYFSVIAVAVEIGNREVESWTQPLVKAAQEGICAFLTKRIHGVYHFLVQAKLEPGNFDIVEMAPTVQCLTGNYQKGFQEYEVPFLSKVLEAKPEQIWYDTMQSEEGGRFFREQNRNLIIEVEENFPTEVPDKFIWMTLNQLKVFISFNNYLNVEARSLISAVQFI